MSDIKPIADLVKEDYEKQIELFAGLTDNAVKGIIFYIQNILKFDKFRLEIHYPPKPTAVIIHLLNPEGEELFCKHKKPEDMINLAKFLKIPNYTIKLAERENDPDTTIEVHS